MTLTEIKARVKFLSKEKAEFQLNHLILTAIASQGDKKAIDKVSADLRKVQES